MTIVDLENEPLRAFVLTFMLDQWPKLVVERLNGNSEWFVYRSLLSQEQVEDWGRTDENLENFVHVVFVGGVATVELNNLIARRLAKACATFKPESAQKSA